MKKMLFFIISLGFFAAMACTDLSQIAGSPSATPTFDSNLLSDIIVKTADTAFTQTAIHASPTFTPTPTFIPGPAILTTATPTVFIGGFRPGDPTATPLGSEITDPNFIAGVEAFFNAKDNQLTIELMSKVIEVHPELAPPYRYRGASYALLNNCTAAMEDVEMALSINPQYAAAWAIRGLASACAGNEVQMMINYQKALSIDPSLAFVHHNLGVFYYNSENYEKSLEEFSLAVAIDPNRAPAWSGKAEALYKLGLYQECIVSASRAIEIDPTEWLAYSDRAYCKDFMGDFEGAIPDYKMYIDNSGDAGAFDWYNLGLAQRKSGDSESAIKSYTKALEINPSYLEAYINRGYAYLTLEKYNEAVKNYNQALEIIDIATAYTGRGDAYYGLKKYDNAIKDYKKATELNPVDAHAYCFLSYSYFEIEEYQNSITTAETSLNINPECGGQKLLETVARSHYELKNYDQALVYINKALAMDDYDLGHYYRGIIYQAMGKTQEALQDLELFISRAQPSEETNKQIADAKARLVKLKK